MTKDRAKIVPPDERPGSLEHVPDCRCRTTEDGKRIMDWNCMTSAQQNLVRALLAAAGTPLDR